MKYLKNIILKNYNKNKLKIKSKGIDNVNDMSYMFYGSSIFIFSKIIKSKF